LTVLSNQYGTQKNSVPPHRYKIVYIVYVDFQPWNLCRFANIYPFDERKYDDRHDATTKNFGKLFL